MKMANLEVMGVVFPKPGDENDDSNASPRTSGRTTTYLAMVDKHRSTSSGAGDDEEAPSATKLAFLKSTLGGPTAMNHRRLILEHLVANNTAPRADLVNLRSQLLSETTQYSLEAATTCVDSMIRDHWLVRVSSSRRVSMNSQLALGPRTFMELPDLLTDQFGLEESQLPQQLYYR
uniref:Uncharacterized protein n=1 Tax=Entomoneis paludosa TaxID=265537 RepID=A0A7S2YD67_9STRA